MLPTIPKRESELKELIEDLSRKSCEGLLTKPWNLWAEATLRESLLERGNQWFRMIRHDPEKWTTKVWAGVYGFPKDKGEGWASRRDSFYVGKFRTDPDPKDGFYPGNCWNLRERRVIEFILPIISPEKPKRLSIIMANTLFRAMSGVRPINWARLIQEYVEKSLLHIGRKPSFLSPYILHLYQHYGCVNEVEEDILTIAEDKVVYKLGPEVEMAETGMEDSSDTTVPEPTSPPPQPEAGPNWEIPWKDIDLSTFEFPEAPFKRVRDELTELQNRYFRMEHITRGVNRALGNCGPGNILRELAKRTDRKQVETRKTENAQLTAHVTAMTRELVQKSEEI